MDFNFINQSVGLSVNEKLYYCLEYSRQTFKLSHVIILCIIIFIMGLLFGFFIRKRLFE